MSTLTDLITIAGNPYDGAAELIRALMADGPNFKLGYTAGNAYAAAMDAAQREGIELNPIIVIDRAFSKPEKPIVYVSVSGGIADAVVTKPFTAVEGNEAATIVLIDWDNWEDSVPGADYLENLVDLALMLKGTHDESAIAQMAEEIEKSLDSYDGDWDDEGSDRWVAQEQLDRLRAAMHKED